MKKHVYKIHNRRQFFRGMLRHAGLALLSAGGAIAVLKRRRLVRQGTCVNRGICRDCGVFDQCGRPRALSVKRAVARARDGQ